MANLNAKVFDMFKIKCKHNNLHTLSENKDMVLVNCCKLYVVAYNDKIYSISNSESDDDIGPVMYFGFDKKISFRFSEKDDFIRFDMHLDSNQDCFDFFNKIVENGVFV